MDAEDNRQDMGESTNRRYQAAEKRLGRALAEAGPVLAGSIVERWTRCGTAGCHCRGDPPRLHGPYPQWNRSVGGRTVTHLLSAEQLGRYQPRIEAARRLRQLLGELENEGATLAETAEGWARAEGRAPKATKPLRDKPSGSSR